MNLSRLRLGLAAAFFVLWMVWLIHLAVTTGRPITLSRPQFLVSNLDIVASIEKLDAPVKVEGVLWPEADAQKWSGKSIEVSNLQSCADSWVGPGRYIIPLMPDRKGGYQVAPISLSPGSPPGRVSKDGMHVDLPARIYPDSPETRRQAQQIQKPTVATLAPRLNDG